MLVNVDSQFRSSGTYSNFTYDVDIPQKHVTVKLLQLQIPMSMNTFTSISIPFIEASTTLFASIPDGNYNDTTILSTLTQALNDAGTQAYTTTLNPQTNTLTISAPSPFTLLFSQTPIYKRLGFTSSNTTSSLSHTSSRPINLSPTDNYYLQVTGLGITPVKSSIGDLGTWPIFLDAPSYAFGMWSYGDVFPPLKGYISTRQLTIQFLYSDGSPCILNDDWNFTLLIS